MANPAEAGAVAPAAVATDLRQGDLIPLQGVTGSSVGETALHYLAGALILGLAFYGAETKIVEPQVFVALLLGAAAAVGFKVSR